MVIWIAVAVAVGDAIGHGRAHVAVPAVVAVAIALAVVILARDRRTLAAVAALAAVAGAVNRPGLYRLAAGSRVDDAIKLAGGATAEADLDALNLASKVKDGDKVLVPKRGAGAGGSGSGGAPGQSSTVNLNTATADQLDALPGIGPALAQRIVAYREQHGGFRTVDELQKVPGIGPAKFAQLKDLVGV